MAYTPDGEIDHGGMEPPYRQLAGILAARIERGDWAPGRAIPSEARLQQEYELSRKTVRRAVSVLAERGLVVTVQGRGSYVASKGDESAG